MNYNSDKTVWFTVKKGNLDINGNTVSHLDFYKQNGGVWVKYKTARTNEDIRNSDADTIVRIWG